MSTETGSTEPESDLDLGRLASGAVGGVVGAILFGLLIEFALIDLTVAIAIPGLYGLEGPLPVAAWGLHLFHGGLLGMVYVVAAQYYPFAKLAHSYGGATMLGVVYGVVLTVGVAVLVTLLGMGTVGVANVVQFPTITRQILVATVLRHVLFATVVALAYATFVRQYDPEAEAVRSRDRSR